MVNDALVQQLLHDLDGRVSLRGLLVFDQPVDELFGHEAVWVSSQVVPPILDHLPFVEPQPGRRQTDKHGGDGRISEVLPSKGENPISQTAEYISL